MGFRLHKGASSSTVSAERFIASGAIAAGMPVALAAGASGVGLGKVAQLSGGANATELLYGVVMNAAADGDEVMVIPADDYGIWEVDAVADTNAANVGQDNYLTATTLTLTVGASTLNGRKCQIIGVLGTAAKRVYLVKFDLYTRYLSTGVALSGRPFRSTVTLTAATGATPVTVLAAASVMAAEKVYITDLLLTVNGATAWTDATATIVTIKDTAASPVTAITAAKAQLTGNAKLGLLSTGITLANNVALGTGMTAGKGLTISSDANFGAGSDIVVTVCGFLA